MNDLRHSSNCRPRQSDMVDLAAGGTRPTGAIDVAVIQKSLNKKGVVADLVADYGQVIVDECHHLSAFRALNR